MDIVRRDNSHMSAAVHLRRVLANNLEKRMAISATCDTQAKLAKRAGVGQSHISRILRGESAATIDMLWAISRALGCMAWELLADDEGARREALARMLVGPAASDLRVGSAIPKPPSHRSKK